MPGRENVVVEVKLGTTVATEVHPCSYMRSQFSMWSKGIVRICENNHVMIYKGNQLVYENIKHDDG